ncbi:MAG: hypothetical protein AAGL24_09950 [Pseudomonadota bacterium]
MKKRVSERDLFTEILADCDRLALIAPDARIATAIRLRRLAIQITRAADFLESEAQKALPSKH